MKVRLTFTEPLLGTASNDPEIHEDFIASKAPDAPSLKEEVAAIGVDEVVAKGKTVFSRDANDNPILWNYQIKGFFKDACGMLSRVKTTDSSKLKAYRKIIDGLIFVFPRQIPLVLAETLGDCQRPLRASTAQGERIALANSEEAPAGTYIELEIGLMDTAHEKQVREWLDYGEIRGLGAWRNSGKGSFTWEEIA